MLKSAIRMFAEEYAEFHSIPVEHVRTVLDGPDETNTYTLRLDSYEYPALETETVRLTADGSAVRDSSPDGDEQCMIYVNVAEMLVDVCRDPWSDGDHGAIGSNWQIAASREAAESEMQQCLKEGWTRGHNHNPRF